MIDTRLTRNCLFAPMMEELDNLYMDIKRKQKCLNKLEDTGKSGLYTSRDIPNIKKLIEHRTFAYFNTMRGFNNVLQRCIELNGEYEFYFDEGIQKHSCRLIEYGEDEVWE